MAALVVHAQLDHIHLLAVFHPDSALFIPILTRSTRQPP